MSAISRRTVAKGAAWAVPAVAVGAATPAYAASGIVQLDGSGCKLPGGATQTFKGYAFNLSIINPDNGAETTVTFESVTLNGEDLGDVLIVDLSTCTVLGTNSVTLDPGETLGNLALLTQNAASSANGQLVVTYSTNNPTNPGGTISTPANAANPLTKQGGGSCDNFSTNEKICLANLAA